MSLSELFLPEFDQEMAGTRRALERVPDGNFEWRPHEKSMPLGYLTSHLAELPSWVAMIMAGDSLDIAPPGEEPYRSRELASRQELLEAFDVNVAAGREALSGASDESLGEMWSLLRGGETIFSMPRAAVLRGMVFNHAVHHRAQLGVYLRLLGAPVPALYGPSADEPV